MTLPRDVGGDELIRRLKRLGYTVSRQTGSHLRLSTTSGGEHHLTIPRHHPVKIGTLNAILNDVAAHFQLSKADLIRELWG